MKITIIGCGWLGEQLATSLAVRNDVEIIKSRRATFDVEHFHHLPAEFNNTDVYVYSVPPLALPKIEKFFLTLPPEQKIIFISSTSVYGKNLGQVDEETILDGCEGNSMLLGVEAFLRDRFKKCTIIRPGGLYGLKRHPITFLAGKKGLTTGCEYTHLVQGADVVKMIEAVIERECFGETFNGVSDLVMFKKDFYTEVARRKNLPLPEYLECEVNNPTKISNVKAKRILGMNFHDPLDS